MDNNNVILFPNTKQKLMDEMFHALNNENYNRALEKSEELFMNKIDSHDVIVVKLISLINLKRLTEAEAFCDTILNVNSPHYDEYLEYYYLILYSSKQYERLIFDYETLRERSLNLTNQANLDVYYDLACQENKREIHELTKKIKKANKENNEQALFRYINRLVSISNNPDDYLISLVNQKAVHP